MSPLLLVPLLWLPLLAAPLAAQDPFQSNVRPTEPLTPEQERAGFQLPPGFEIQLVASEPDILKPMNMAFDQRGRLWITDSIEYPYAAPADRPGRDTIKILEDTDGDGRADRVTTFADGLNIPIGILPVPGGAIAYSIPNIWFLRDTDGDDRADERIKLYGPMGFERDTHGMNNAFRRDFDGWIYACHGFNNETTVSGRDGHVVRMQSGNTYRMRPDGRRVEHFTWGQVNPFGMTVDALGNRFTADCHSKPIYQLVRGGYYPSFGKPHDGLGFVPPMMDHLHGSTAIAGVAQYSGTNYPAEYRGNFFSGNVMTSRVNRNRLEYHGATIKAVEQPDFLVASDPWFRPVDVRLGPDGALYVADFYNRIIGHYEVPLDHPGRDRHRGRIWRIVYRGDAEGTEPARMPPPLSELDSEQRIAALDDPCLTRRLLATNYLADTADAQTLDALQRTLQSNGSDRLRAHGLWVLFRRDQLSDELLLRAASDVERLPATHAMQILAAMPEWSEPHFAAARRGLEHGDAFVRRAAAEALGLHPSPGNLQPLLRALAEASERDAILRHTIRLAIRNHLREDDVFAALERMKLSDREMDQLAPICLALPSARAASFLMGYLERADVPRAQLADYVRHAARHIAPDETPALAQFAQRRFADDLDFQQMLLHAMVTGIEQRGGEYPTQLRDWADTVAAALLESALPESSNPSAGWTNLPLAGMPTDENPWELQRRASEDGDSQSLFLCSLPHGERLTGVLRSPAFEIPPRLSFYTAGHLGFPNQPLVPRNFIRLRDAATHQLLVEARPPRHDTARRVEWNLEEHAGKRGYLELVDGDDRPAYAWLAVGRFDPAVVRPPAVSPRAASQRMRSAAGLIGKFQLQRFASRLEDLLSTAGREPAVSEALAAALLQLRPDAQLQALVPLIGDPALGSVLRRRILDSLLARNPRDTTDALAEALRAAPSRGQQLLAQALAGDKANSQRLLELVEKGQTSPRLLRDPTVIARLKALHGEEIAARVESLTAGLGSDDAERRELIEQRRRGFAQAALSLDEGRRVFEKNCASCHQVAGQGALVGPQLDGIGNRGLDRMLEDVLDPNRNVDIAFHTTTLALADGKVVSGLLRSEEGSQLLLVDSQGKPFTVEKDDVEQRRTIRLSLMPENLVQRMTEAEFYHLLAYLLEQRGG